MILDLPPRPLTPDRSTLDYEHAGQLGTWIRAVIGKVLVVRHGPGRGRIPSYMEGALAALRKRAGAEDRVALHHTGDGEPSLDGVRTVVFWLADPLKEWYPACYAEATEIAKRAHDLGIRTVNSPDSFSNTIKSRQSRLWLDAGFDTPLWIRFQDVDGLHAAIEEIGFPAVIRSDEAHSRMGLSLITSEKSLAALDVQRVMLPGCMSHLLDLRHGKRKVGSDPVYSRLHHKKRLYVLDPHVRTEHLFFSKSPFVSASSCTFAPFKRVPEALHWLHGLRSRDRAIVREDISYWERREEHSDLMLRAARTLGLGYAAIDYSERADGSVVLWEANPHPSLPPYEGIRLPRQRRARERIESYYRAIGDFLMDLADHPVGARISGPETSAG